jgi:hypothetical protein
MKRPYRLITGGALLLLLVIAAPAAWGQETDSGEYISLFKGKAELAPGFSAARPPEVPFAGKLPGDSLSEILNLPVGKGEDIFPLREAGDGRKDTLRPSGFDLYYFRLSFSRAVLEQPGMDILRQRKEDSDTLSKIRSLPSMLGNSSPQEAFGAIGDIFRPQLNLEIDF